MYVHKILYTNMAPKNNLPLSVLLMWQFILSLEFEVVVISCNDLVLLFSVVDSNTFSLSLLSVTISFALVAICLFVNGFGFITFALVSILFVPGFGCICFTLAPILLV